MTEEVFPVALAAATALCRAAAGEEELPT
jgi:hypothetical protein